MALTIAQALATARLAPIDARALLRHALVVDDAYLIAHSGTALTDAQSGLFSALVERRRAGVPVAYITGQREFFSLEFNVTPAVLIPRPETELLVDVALELLPADQVCDVLDLGTGSGSIAISVAWHRPRARVTAVDRSDEALAVARENAQRLVGDPALAHGNLTLLSSDWFSAVTGRRYHVIVSNPPYIAAGDPHLSEGDLRFEPISALAAGSEGLACIRLIIGAAPQYLLRGGWLAFEHGYDQGPRCRGLLLEAGYVQVFTRTDLAGCPRVSGGQWNASA